MAHVFFVRTNFSYEKTVSLKFGITNFNILGIIKLKQKQTKIYREMQFKHAVKKCDQAQLFKFGTENRNKSASVQIC